MPSHDARPVVPPPAKVVAAAGRMTARKVLFGLASGAISAAFLALLWSGHRLTLARLEAAWQQADKGLLAAVIVGSCLFHVFVGAHKLHRILRAMDIDIGYLETVRMRLGMGPLRIVLPLGLGDYLPIVYFWKRHRMSLDRASGAVLFDKGLNLLGGVFWLVIGLAFMAVRTGGAEGVWRAVLIALAAAACGITLFQRQVSTAAIAAGSRLHPRLGVLAEGLLAPLREFSWSRDAYFIAYGIAFQARPLAVFFALLVCFGLPHPADAVLAYGSLAVSAGWIPGPLLGLGPREAVIVHGFHGCGGAPDVLFAVGLLMSLAVNVIPLIIGLPWTLWLVRRLRRERATVAEGAT